MGIQHYINPLLHTKKPLSEDDFGAITFAVKTNTSGLNLYVYLVDENGQMDGLALPVSDFLYSGEISSDWKIAWIPLRKLIRRPTQGTFVFNGIGVESTMTGKVWVDEVKVREEFKLPLPGERSWLLTSETGDSGCNGANPPLPSHTNNNYFSLDFDDISAIGVIESNVPVLASAGGKVVFAGANQYNGTFVVVNHDYQEKADGLETFYLHLKADSLQVETGDYVTLGQQLGILGKTGTDGTHIHLGFYYDYNGGSNVDILNFLTMEGLKLDEYIATCTGDSPNRYFPSTQ